MSRLKILINKAQCNNCKDIIESRYTHHFVTCSCGQTHVDGGLNYLKRGYGDKGYTDMSVYESGIERPVSAPKPQTVRI